jgi:DNA adenine methylase
MKYMGSKRRIAKFILPIILEDREASQWYVEPFCGGCNSLDKVENPRLGNDSNKYLIALLKELQTQIPFTPPYVGEKDYKNIKLNKDLYPDWLVGYVGFNLSFGAKFFGGYRRDKKGIRDYENEAQQNLKAQQNLLKGIVFTCGSYSTLHIPKKSIIYCDPPYKNTTKYRTESFDYSSFYTWCIQQKSRGHKVYVSEYKLPHPFVCIWGKDVSSNLTVADKNRKQTERLYTLK